MNLFNKIEKVKYVSNNPNEFVSLVEYILFEDQRNGDKYLVFKFENNLNQSLYQVQFEVCQYNENNDLIEKSEVSFKNFKAKTKESFVPNGKMKANKDCKSISVKLLAARFEKVVFSNGEIAPIPYTYEDYKKEYGEMVESKKKPKSKREIKFLKKQAKLNRKLTIKAEKIKLRREKYQKKENSVFKRKDITHKHRVRFPGFLNFVATVGLLACVIYGAIFARNNASYFTTNYTDYAYDSDGEVRIIGCEKITDSYVIDEYIMEYKIRKVVGEEGKAAFNQSRIQSLTINSSDFIIGSNSFFDCDSLEYIYSDQSVFINSDAFAYCSSIKEINMKNSTAYKNSFLISGASVEYIYLDKVVGCSTLGELFGCSNEELTNLKYVYINQPVSRYGEFFGGIPAGVIVYN